MKTLIEFVKKNLKKKVFLFKFDVEAEIVGYNLYLNSIIVRPLDSSFGWKEQCSVYRGKEKILFGTYCILLKIMQKYFNK